MFTSRGAPRIRGTRQCLKTDSVTIGSALCSRKWTNEQEPCSATIREAKRKNCEKNHASKRPSPICLLLSGVPLYSAKKPMNMTAAEIKSGTPLRPKPAFPTMVWKPAVILSKPAPRLYGSSSSRTTLMGSKRT